MFVSQTKFHSIPSISITSYSICDDFIAYASNEEGLVVKHLQNGKVIFQINRNHYSKLHLTPHFFVYLKNGQIRIHHREKSSNSISSTFSTISVPFRSSFCQNFSPYISDLSVDNGVSLAYVTNFQDKVEVKVYDLKIKEETVNIVLDKHTGNDYEFDCYMESPLIRIYKNKLLCTTGGTVVYLFDDIFSKQKPKVFHNEGDIIRIFMEYDSIGFVVEDTNSTICFIHYDLTTNERFCHTISTCTISSFPKILNTINKSENRFFFCNQDKKNQTVIHQIRFTNSSTKVESYPVNHNIRFMSFKNGSVVTIGRKNISSFVLLQKRDILLPLFKGSIERKFGTIHENIDVKRYIFEFLSNESLENKFMKSISDNI